jgi:cytochrome c oxidase assembly protein subunit 15
LTYAQLILGAIVRHVPLGAAPSVFRAALLIHLLLAAVLTFHVFIAAWRQRQLPSEGRGLRLIALTAPTLVIIQVLLGVATYVAKYAFPAWLGAYAFAAHFVVQEKSLTQSLITTAHVANGSLILFVSVFVALRATRLFHRRAGTFACPEAACPGAWQTSLLAARWRAIS